MPPANSPTRPPHWLLRRAEQAVVAGFVVAGLMSVVWWWAAHGGLSGRMVELEKAEPRTAQFQVDINGAGWPELAELPGIGRTVAERIVQSRDLDGPFADLDDLRRVRGIGPKTLETLRPYLRPMPKRAAVAGR